MMNNKSHIFVFFALFLFFTCITTSYLCKDVNIMLWAKKGRVALPHPQESEMGKLDNVLKNAAMDNRTVILVTLNEAWAKPNSILDIFLESFRIGEQTQSLLKHIVVIAIDEKAMRRCKEMKLHCYFLAINGLNSTRSEKRYMSKDYITLIWEKLHFYGKVLQLGYNFLVTDIDVLWFRAPFEHLSASDDISVSCDFFTGNSSDIDNVANVGFMYAKSNNRTIKFYEHWYRTRSKFPGGPTQQVFEEIKVGRFASDLGIKIRYLDTEIFGGFCEHGNDLNKLHTLHATCCVGLKTKIHDLRIVLGVWKKFLRLPKDEKIKGIRWRAPIECRLQW